MLLLCLHPAQAVGAEVPAEPEPPTELPPLRLSSWFGMEDLGPTTALGFLSAVLLAGCFLDEVWEDTVTVTSTQPWITGTVFTEPTPEGNTSGCQFPDERFVHGTFDGPGEFPFEAITESEQERSTLFVSVLCTAHGEDGFETVYGFTFGPSEPRVIVLPDPAVTGCSDPDSR